MDTEMVMVMAMAMVMKDVMELSISYENWAKRTIIEIFINLKDGLNVFSNLFEFGDGIAAMVMVMEKMYLVVVNFRLGIGQCDGGDGCGGDGGTGGGTGPSP